MSNVPEISIQVSASPIRHFDNLSSIALGQAADVFESYPPSLLYFAAFCCVLFITVGVPGNAVTVLALGRSKRVSCNLLHFMNFGNATSYWYRTTIKKINLNNASIHGFLDGGYRVDHVLTIQSIFY